MRWEEEREKREKEGKKKEQKNERVREERHCEEESKGDRGGEKRGVCVCVCVWVGGEECKELKQSLGMLRSSLSVPQG